MTDHDTELKLQALLDGELSAAESESAKALVSRDPEARGLYGDLQATKALLAGNEPETKVPDSREFYWSGIARGIEREERKDRMEQPQAPASWWRRLLVPAGVVAAVAIAVTVGLRPPGGANAGFPALAGSHDIETPLEDSPSFTFRSEAEAMTVVWVDSGPN
jgi:negative regulator of sigma E activity